MDHNFQIAGIACVCSAIVGGGFEAFGIKIPLLSSVKRQVLLASFGGVLLITGAVVDTSSSGKRALPSDAPESRTQQEQPTSSPSASTASESSSSSPDRPRRPSSSWVKALSDWWRTPPPKYSVKYESYIIGGTQDCSKLSNDSGALVGDAQLNIVGDELHKNLSAPISVRIQVETQVGNAVYNGNGDPRQFAVCGISPGNYTVFMKGDALKTGQFFGPIEVRAGGETHVFFSIDEAH
jgi:hypothetical protein